jgi:hypothetical protein
VGEFLAQLWQNIIGRASGPMSLRLFLQPSVAAFFAIRAGLRDARKGRRPYGWTLIFVAHGRHDLLREGWGDVGKVFIIATILDGIYQLMVFHRLYVLGAMLIAAKLALIPYLLIRGLANRIASLRYRSRNS